MKIGMSSHAASRLNHLSCCRMRQDKKITRTNQKAMGLHAGCSRGNLGRLGFIASLSHIMMLGLWAALVCRAPAPQPASIWLWGRSWYWPDCTETSPNRLNLSLRCSHTFTRDENMQDMQHTQWGVWTNMLKINLFSFTQTFTNYILFVYRHIHI